METPTKETLLIELDKIFAETINWVNEQPKDHFNKEMVAEKWTMAGHLYHLVKTTKEVSKGLAMPKLALRTAFGKCNRAERTFDQQYKKYTDSLANIAKTTGKPLTPPEKFVPTEGSVFDKIELINRFNEEQSNIKNQITKWKEKDLNRYLLPHPAMGKLTVREMIYFVIFHTRHHLDNLKNNYVEK